MKQLIILGISLFSLGAVADHQAIDEARALVQALTKASHEALILADREAKHGHFQQVTNLDQVSNEALQMARQLHRRVYRQILIGGDEAKIKAELATHHDTFEHLEEHLKTVGHEGEAILQAIEDADRHFHELEELLAAGGAVTVSCTARSGGNFFRPKTHATCTVFGRGVVGYEVVFTKPGFGSTSRAGALNPNLPQQKFETEKVQIGWNPGYQVFLIDRQGNKTKVAEGVAEGSQL